MRSYIAIATLLLAASCGAISSTNSDSGTGGSPGTGGSTGSGGTGKGGDGGNGGSTGGPSCAQIEVAYEAALATARKCSVDGSNQCQKMVAGGLGCSGCPTFVNDDSGLSQVHDAWNQAGCNQNLVCTDGACLSPKAATCEAGDASGGTCVDSFLTRRAAPAN